MDQSEHATTRSQTRHRFGNHVKHHGRRIKPGGLEPSWGLLGLDMHVHASYFCSMRTTIEITDNQRSQLLAIAANRGMNGFSAIVREALAEYLNKKTGDREILKAALETQGSLTGREADELETKCMELRGQWR